MESQLPAEFSDLAVFANSEFEPTTEMIGSGSFSTVWVWKRKTPSDDYGELVAAKVLNPEVAIMGEDAFLKEAALLQRYTRGSPYLVNLQGVVLRPNHVFIMDCYKKSGALDKALLEDFTAFPKDNESKFPVLRRLGYMHDLSRAVQHLHENNLAHRDIATRNLLLSDDLSHVLLTDFSLARIVDSKNVEKNFTVMPSIPKTSPPESWSRGDKRVFSLKSDVWTMAVAFHEIVNKRPAAAETFGPWLKNVPGTNAVVPVSLCRPGSTFYEEGVFDRGNALWTEVLVRCWVAKPEERPGSWQIEKKLANLVQFPVSERAKGADAYDTQVSIADLKSRPSRQSQLPPMFKSKTRLWTPNTPAAASPSDKSRKFSMVPSEQTVETPCISDTPPSPDISSTPVDKSFSPHAPRDHPPGPQNKNTQPKHRTDPSRLRVHPDVWLDPTSNTSNSLGHFASNTSSPPTNGMTFPTIRVNRTEPGEKI